ncbi:MAG: hypothetical protein IT320_05805 [Anaerolineae bacterium]|nr:hypothetical protein [Anaerolineae bacterium]
MKYYLDLFSPETYEAFLRSDRRISGFRLRHQNAASRIQPGDRLICYLTKLSRWIGVLEVETEFFIQHTPIFYDSQDPFIVRFNVNPLALLPIEKAIPIHDDFVWSQLSFTRTHPHNSYRWTGKIRSSLVQLDDGDAGLLENLIFDQAANGQIYEYDRDEYQKLISHQVRRVDKTVSVTVPNGEEELSEDDSQPLEIRESHRIQALLADLGSKMGMKIWIPKSDRNSVLQEWHDLDSMLLNILPLNYDDTTLKTIEQIDVIWLRGRSIVRAFEVEHTTSVYSGILRMADLMALQPNMDIKLHIVAPYARREKVFQEIRRPVFSLLEKGPLSEHCTFISYDSLQELAQLRHLSHMSDTVLEDYAEEAE